MNFKDALKKHSIGRFTNETGSMTFIDPCYNECQEFGVKLPVQRGCWHLVIFGNRNEAIAFIHEDIIHAVDWDDIEIALSTNPIANLGVDSGQLCAFDSDFIFKESEALGKPLFTWDGSAQGHSKFYRACCHYTLTADFNAGTLDHGGVSSTSYGDGEYPLFTTNQKAWQGKLYVIFTGDFPEEE